MRHPARPLAALAAAILLAACGADGEPQAPAPTTGGITMSGEVQFGIVSK